MSRSATRTRCRSWRSRRCTPGLPRRSSRSSTIRQPDGANPAQVLGYLQPITQQEIAQRHLVVTGFSGVDLVGQAGLEAEYDAQLRGEPGTQTVAVNAAGDVTGTVSQVPPQSRRRPGHQHRREGPGDRAERADLSDRQVEGLGQQRQPGRGDRGDDHRPDRGHGQLPGVQPERVDQRHLRSRSSTTCSAPRPASRSSTGPPRASTRPGRRSRSRDRPRRWPTGTAERPVRCPASSPSTGTTTLTTASRASAT